MTFIDSLGNIGFQWGYARDNSVYGRDSPSNSWNTTSFVADQSNWDGLQIKIDLSADTFAINYFDVSTNTTTNMVPAGTPMGMPMTDVTHIGWKLENGLNAGQGGKNFFDDFMFTAVPEPSCFVMLAIGLGVASGRKRR